MVDIKKVLDAWLMVERLSEGDINIKDKNLLSLSNAIDNDYLLLIENNLPTKEEFKKKGGFVIYVDIFPFEDVVRKVIVNKGKTYEGEFSKSFKFGFSLYFNANSDFLPDKTFVTVSRYILENNKVPSAEEFETYETDIQNKLDFLWSNVKEEGQEFNQFIEYVFQIYKINEGNVRFKKIDNLESDIQNLHSFFYLDLMKVRNTDSKNVSKYILGEKSNRINLDVEEKSNHQYFFDILEPLNYPLGRFPSNTQYALSLMQQVAVNLSIGYDVEHMRSVNGPPGTGKTTLLKDIFAELVVQQAQEILKLSDKEMVGNENTVYYKNATIGIVPDSIAEKNIVVASSNNGAVQNIVKELPLNSGIDNELLPQLLEVDYFNKTVNNLYKQESTTLNEFKDDNAIVQNTSSENLYWGLFSLEGGKKANIDLILRALDLVKVELKEFVPNSNVYNDFKKQLSEVQSYRQSVQEQYENQNKKISQMKELEETLPLCETKMHEAEERLQRYRKNNASLIQEKEKVVQLLENDILEKNHNEAKLKEKLVNLNQAWELHGLKYSWWNILRFFDNEFKNKNQYFREELSKLYIDKNIIIEERDRLEESLKDCKNEIEKIKNNIFELEDEFKRRVTIHKEKSNSYTALKAELKNRMGLNFSKSYEELQLNNPWFSEEYRKMQSGLFVSALKVRKQFIYENRKNINGAINIWKNRGTQDEALLNIAWQWINFVIPVISSTFASFGNMFSRMGKGSVGHLFIDEAGQALPQASVGAIYRSKHIMVVGDPSQIKPVLTLEPRVLKAIGEKYGVGERYLSEDASTQTLVDAASKYGYYKNKEKTEWIGIPLWVHRRCRYPMFDISNNISYGGKMVQAPGENLNGKADWYDVGGEAYDKYVKAQGELLEKKILEIAKDRPEVCNKDEKDIIYVITPFKNVAYKLAEQLKKINFTRTDENNKVTNIGTVHTFQGKEAEIVFFVLGADSKSTGAAQWAVGNSNPNIMNVAVTRAKKEFYVIGDRKLYKSLQSEVVDITDREIIRFNQLSN